MSEYPVCWLAKARMTSDGDLMPDFQVAESKCAEDRPTDRRHRWSRQSLQRSLVRHHTAVGEVVQYSSAPSCHAATARRAVRKPSQMPRHVSAPAHNADACMPPSYL